MPSTSEPTGQPTSDKPTKSPSQYPVTDTPSAVPTNVSDIIHLFYLLVFDSFFSISF